MHRPVCLSLLLALGCASACGGESPDGPTACEVGPGIRDQAIAALQASAPACASDDDCVTVDTSIDCTGVSIELCGTIMHKAIASGWLAARVCQEIDRASAPSGTSCGVSASCTNVRPACIAAVCTGARN